MRQFTRTEFGLYAAATRAADTAAAAANFAELAMLAASSFPSPEHRQLAHDSDQIARRAQRLSNDLHRAAGLTSLPLFWPIP